VPTYVCVVKAGLLNNQQKQRIASAITRLHSETTGAPTWLVQVVIDENEQRQRYLNGKPADHQIWIRADIRAGRSSEQRQRLMLGIVQALGEISGVEGEHHLGLSLQPRTGRHGGIRPRAAAAGQRTGVVRSIAS
jgi:phenylpyruvate tautomerase PptA (4-oxalocrotonate tautomerase family)